MNLSRLLPGLRFEVRQVLVVGPPWSTRIHASLAFHVPHGAGGPYRNDVMQSMHMRWGRITRVHTVEDTERCARYLAWRASTGLAEAAAAPITDQPWPEPGPFMRAASRISAADSASAG